MTEPSPTIRSSLARWFRTPPRAHGEANRERSVGYLELFYDLVFVAFVAQISGHLSGDVGWPKLVDFAVVFGLMWTAWMNGSLYHEAHGRDDGRHRAYVFAQMFILMALAVFAGGATGDHARAFALAYTALLALLTFQWATVWRIDTVPRFRRQAGQYVAFMTSFTVAMLASAFVEGIARDAIWFGVIVVSFAVLVVKMSKSEGGEEGPAIAVTESLADRFNSFTIIVLGEVVVGVINGIIQADATVEALAVGLLGMSIGFGFWWNYFDALGGQLPRERANTMGVWMGLHLPLHAAVAACGAGMVALIGHSGTGTVGGGTRWLLSGATALLLVLIAGLARTIDYDEAVRPVLRPFELSLVAGAALSLVVGLLAPTGWSLALLLALVLLGTWVLAFVVRARCGLHKSGF